jgi:hypothetical protein
MHVKSELNSVKKLVLRVLEHYPETRNSDNKLYIQCAKELGAKTIDDLMEINLNLITLHKTRQKIQNRDFMFLPDKEVAEARYERQLEFKEWMIE